MISPLSPQPRSFEKGVSYVMITKSMEKIMGEMEERTMMVKIGHLLEGIWDKTLEISLLLFLENRKMVVAVPKKMKRKNVIQWSEARNRDKESKIIRRVVLDRNKTTELDSSMLAITIVKYKDDEDEGLNQENEKKGYWILSRTNYRERVHMIMKEALSIGYLEGYTNAIVKVCFQGASTNVKKSIYERLSLSGKQELRKRAEYLESICGIPEKDIEGRARKVRCDISVEDKNIKEKVRSLSKYIIQRKSTDKDEVECLQRLARRIATQGITKENMETLDSQWKKGKGEKAKGCSYRIGAYIPNAGILLQYTHAKGKSEACGWFPLKFGRLQEGAYTLRAVRDIDTDEFGCKVIGVPLSHFKPRLLCFMIHKGKKKIINGEIYDLKALGKDDFKGGRNLPLYSLTESYQLWTPKRGEEQGKEEEKRKEERMTRMPCLPVQMMTQCDKAIKQVIEEEKSENCPKQKNDNTEISSDGPVEGETMVEQHTEEERNITDRSLLEEGRGQEVTQREKEEMKERGNDVFISPQPQLITPASVDARLSTEYALSNHITPELFNSEMSEINECAQLDTKEHENNSAQNNARDVKTAIISTPLNPEDNYIIQTLDGRVDESTLKCVKTDIDESTTEYAQTHENTYQQPQKTNLAPESLEIPEIDEIEGQMPSNEIQKKSKTIDVETTNTPHMHSSINTTAEENGSQVQNSDPETSENEIEIEGREINDLPPNLDKIGDTNIEPHDANGEEDSGYMSIRRPPHKSTGNSLERFGTNRVSSNENLNKNLWDEDCAEPSTPGAAEPRVEVTDSEGELKITINLRNYNISGKQISIQITAPDPSNERTCASCDTLVHRSVGKGERGVCCDGFWTNEKKREEKSPESEKRQRQDPPKKDKSNIFEAAKTTRDKERTSNIYNSPQIESVARRMEGNLPVMIRRKGEIDIYGTGRASEQKEYVRINQQHQWYDDVWFKIFDKKELYRSEGFATRKISQKLKEKFVNTLASAEDSVIERMWLNLPSFLMHPNQKELNEMFSNVGNENLNKETLAESQFYKGAWGKAYKTLMGINEGQIGMSEEDIERLFPSCESDTNTSMQFRINVGDEKRLITAKEIKNTIKTLPNGKAVGISGCSYEVVKSIAGMKKGREAIARMYNYAISHPEEMHPQIYTSKCVGIPKKTGGARPLCMQETIIKPLHKIISSKIEAIVRKHIENVQKCLSKTEGQISAWERVMSEVEKNKNAVIIQFDFSNAFGTIDRGFIIKRLIDYNIPGEFINYIDKMLKRQRIIYTGNDNIDKMRIINRGVPQGEPLSMLLFALGIDEMLQIIEKEGKAKVTAYADDVVLVLKDEENIREIINTFVLMSEERGLSVNIQKTKIGYKKELKEETCEELKQKGIECVDIEKDRLEYLSLPISMNKRMLEKHVKEKTKVFIETTEEMWSKDIPTQMKYHLQEMCINSKMVYLYKAIPLNDNDNKNVKWVKKMQKRLDTIWEKYFNKENKTWWRIPIKLYGLGLFNIKDRRKIARMNYELKRSEKEEGAGKREIWREFFEGKIEEWIRKRRIQKIDLSALPPYVNTTLLSPPTEQGMKLDNLAFRLMIELRYCSNGMNIYRKGEIGKRKCKCPLHNEPWTLQHVISCPLSCLQAVRLQHDRLVQYVSGILLRSHKVENVMRERKTIEQEKRMREGKEAKRADITYWRDGKQHSLDISVTTSWSKQKWRNPVKSRKRGKEKEYKKEENVHIVLFDTAGGITEDAWKLLMDMGASSYDLRRLQTIIYRSNARRYQVICTNCKNDIYKKGREKKLEERGNWEKGKL